MDPVAELKYRLAEKRSTRRPINGLARTGIFFSCVLAGLLTFGLVYGLLVGALVLAVIYLKNKKVVRKRNRQLRRLSNLRR